MSFTTSSTTSAPSSWDQEILAEISAQWNEEGDLFKLKYRSRTPLQGVTATIYQRGKKCCVEGENITWSGVDGLSNKKINKLLEECRFDIRIIPSPNGSFQIEIDLKKSTNEILASNASSSSSSSDSHQQSDSMTTLIDVQDTRQLAHYLQKKNSDSSIYPLLNKIINGFIGLEVPNQHQLQEVIEIVGYLREKDQQRVVNKLFNIMDKSTDLSLHIEITKIFILCQRSEVVVNDKDNLSTVSLREDWIEFTKRMLNKLRNVSHSDSKIVKCYFRMLISLLEVRINLCLKSHEIQRDEVSYQGIEAYFTHSDPTIVFLATYADQCRRLMACDSNDQGNALGHLAKLLLRYKPFSTDAKHTFKPWAILKAKSLDFVRGFHSQHQAWFAYLVILRQGYLISRSSRSLKDFFLFAEAVEKEEDLVKIKILEHQHPLFIQGLVELLCEMMGIYSARQPKMAEYIAKLIVDIGSVNREGGNQISTDRLFKVKESKRSEEIKATILNVFKNYHDVPQLNTLTRTIISTWLESEQENWNPEQSIEPSSFPHQLFDAAMKDIAPWIPDVRNHLKKYLDQDEQVKENRDYIVSLKCEDLALSESQKPLEMEPRLKGLLDEGKTQVIVVLGHSGSGKTLFLKDNVLSQLESYQIGNPLPIFVPLITLNDPRQNLFDEVLKKYHLFEFKKTLQDMPTIWYLDGYDETFMGNKKDLYKLFPDKLSEEWPQAKLVVTCRRDFLSVNECTQYFSLSSSTDIQTISPGVGGGASLSSLPIPSYMSILSIAPFISDDVDVFLNKFIKKVRQDNQSKQEEQPPRLFWEKPSDYREYITKLDLGGMISNPFNLRIMAEMLPEIVKRCAESKEQLKEQLTEGSLRKISKIRLFDEWMFYRIRIEYLKQQQARSTPYSPSNYLSFALKLSQYMEICNKRSVLEGEQELLEKEAKKYIKRQRQELKTLEEKKGRQDSDFAITMQKIFNKELVIDKEEAKRKHQQEIQQLDYKIKTCNKNLQRAQKAPIELYKRLFHEEYVSRRRACFLVKNGEKRVEFMHPSIYEYLRGLDEVKEDKEYIQQLLNKIEVNNSNAR